LKFIYPYSIPNQQLKKRFHQQYPKLLGGFSADWPKLVNSFFSINFVTNDKVTINVDDSFKMHLDLLTKYNFEFKWFSPGNNRIWVWLEPIPSMEH